MALNRFGPDRSRRVLHSRFMRPRPGDRGRAAGLRAETHYNTVRTFRQPSYRSADPRTIGDRPDPGCILLAPGLSASLLALSGTETEERFARWDPPGAAVAAAAAGGWQRGTVDGDGARSRPRRGGRSARTWVIKVGTSVLTGPRGGSIRQDRPPVGADERRDGYRVPGGARERRGGRAGIGQLGLAGVPKTSASSRRPPPLDRPT